jgi:hypothetical protein
MRFSTRQRDGTRRVFEASGRPIRGPEEGIGGVVVIRDVTNR